MRVLTRTRLIASHPVIFMIQVLSPNLFLEQQSRHLTPSEAEQFLRLNGRSFPDSNFFVIGRLESGYQYLKFPIPLHRPNFYSIMLVSRGEVVRTDGLNSYTVGEGSIYFHPVNQITSTHSGSSDVHGYYCLFDAEFFLSTFKNNRILEEMPFFAGKASPVVTTEPEVFEYLTYLLNRVEQEFSENHPCPQPAIGSLLHVFLLEACKYSRSVQEYLYQYHASSASLLTHNFKNLLQLHIFTRRTVSEYADLLCVTPDHLNRCVKQITGKKAKELITDMVLLEACVLLKQTGLSISEIAFQLSFANPSHFVRLFKGHNGLTPLDYRQKNKMFPR
jgi:AraC-like DNA-binding protein